MADDDSYQKLLDQLAGILRMTEEASKQTKKGPLPQGSIDQLRAIEEMMVYFKMMNQQFLKDAGFTDEEIANPQPPAPGAQSDYERELVEKSNLLAKEAKNKFAQLKSDAKREKLQKDPKGRKKKFDRLGGRDKWKKL